MNHTEDALTISPNRTNQAKIMIATADILNLMTKRAQGCVQILFYHLESYGMINYICINQLLKII